MRGRAGGGGGGGGGGDSGPGCARALRRLARALADGDPPPRPAELGLTPRELAHCLERAASVLEAEQADTARQADTAQGALDLSPPAPGPGPAEEPDSFHVLHADGGSRGNPGPAGAGAALLDPRGREVALLRRYLGVTTNNVAEYQGLILGLTAALARGIERLEVRLDSELLVRQLQGRYKVKAAHLLPLFHEARALLARFAQTRLTHIPRAQNARADALANQAMDER